MRANFKHSTPALFPNIRGHAMTAHKNSIPITHNIFETLVHEVQVMRGVEKSAVLLLDLLSLELRAAIKSGNMGAVSAVASNLESGSGVLIAAIVENAVKI